VFSNQVTNIITLLKEKYKIPINLHDKVVIYKFCEGNKNTHLYRNIIIDFIALIKFLNSRNKENEIKEDKKIYDVINDTKDVTSKDFIKLFEQPNELLIGKTPEIFEYYLKVIFEDVFIEVKKNQKSLDKKTKEEISKEINTYFENNHHISKEDFVYAIRLFITLVLFIEEDKNKIKSNTNNIMKYLKSSDFWKKEIYNDVDKFNKNINEFKSMNFKINNIISIYEILSKNIENNNFEDVIRFIKEEKEKDQNNVEEEEEEEEEPKSDDGSDRD
jgi:hypothetical protein